MSHLTMTPAERGDHGRMPSATGRGWRTGRGCHPRCVAFEGEDSVKHDPEARDFPQQQPTWTNVRLLSAALPGPMEVPPHRDRRRVVNQRAEDRGVGRPKSPWVVRVGDPKSQTRAERQRDMARERPGHHPP